MSYTIKEIIDIAVGIEDSGYVYYTRCAGTFKDNPVRDVFDFLAREEQEHKKLFQSLHGTHAAQGVFTDEYFAYLKAIGGGRIFEKQEMTIDMILDSIKNPMDAVKHAFGAEKDSILLYSEMKQLYTGDPLTSSLLDKIIDEERKHVAMLLDLLEKIRFAS